ncbi:MAG: hypothetical protein GWO23_19880, partial [Gammaproteobacteria bacterium]|nr:hypothetical protein [Gammaproteobacteria bacterium]NIR15561.1 hypothetical protein [Desulfobacterales bacterium]NIR25865.1 hypothetical protein [Gammaproteobacteria bacterium]NIU80817.1 hypothetical protein [Candidatus Bathyarchaeota archaeon]NIV68206.1 hypothetical protein [Candidatus Bathyarchaeota archaeon]
MSYYLDYHIYMYTVTVRTIADKNEVKNDWWEHETSWPWNQYNKLSGTGVNEKLGEKFAGGVYVKFIIDPWQGFTYRDPPPSENPEEEWYALEGCWAGVMNTYVADRRLGQVENQWGDSPDPDDDAQKFVGAGLDEGNQVPMLLDDGAYGSPAPDIDWDPTVTPDEDIESSVVQYLPIEMQPGADIDYDRWGYAIALNPCDVYVMYTLRVDVLT